jgi:hypothetical protein
MAWLRVVSVAKWGSPELLRGAAELRAKFVMWSERCFVGCDVRRSYVRCSIDSRR